MEIQRACNANLLMPARCTAGLRGKGNLFSGDLRLSSNKHANSPIRARPEKMARRNGDPAFPITRASITRPRRSWFRLKCISCARNRCSSFTSCFDNTSTTILHRWNFTQHAIIIARSIPSSLIFLLFIDYRSLARCQLCTTGFYLNLKRAIVLFFLDFKFKIDSFEKKLEISTNHRSISFSRPLRDSISDLQDQVKTEIRKN